MSVELASPSNRPALRSGVRRVLFGHHIRPEDLGLRGVGRASNVVTAIASVLVLAGIVGALLFFTVAQFASQGDRNTAADLGTLSLLTIAVGLTLRFIGAVVNLYAQSFARPRTRLATIAITAGFAALLLMGGFLLFWVLALLAVVGLGLVIVIVLVILVIAGAGGVGLAVLVGKLLPGKDHVE